MVDTEEVNYFMILLLNDSEGGLILITLSKVFTKGLVGDVMFFTSCKSKCFALMLWGGGKTMACKKKNNGQSCEQGVITMSDTI